MKQEHQLTDKEREAFETYVWTLSAASVPWLFLRDYESFPAAIRSQVTIFVPRLALARAQQLLARAIRGAGGVIGRETSRDDLCSVEFTLADSTGPLRLELHHGACTWHGLAFLLDERLLGASRENAGGYPAPCPAHEALVRFLHPLLWRGQIEAALAPLLSRLLDDAGEKAEFDWCMAAAFGETSVPADSLLEITQLPAEQQVALARRLRRALAGHALRLNPLAALGRLGRYRLSKLKALAASGR